MNEKKSEIIVRVLAVIAMIFYLGYFFIGRNPAFILLGMFFLFTAVLIDDIFAWKKTKRFPRKTIMWAFILLAQLYLTIRWF